MIVPTVGTTTEYHGNGIQVNVNTVPSNDPCEDYHAIGTVGDWTFVGVFDGHGGTRCAAHLQQHLFSLLQTRIGTETNPTTIKSIIKQAFLEMDHSLLECRGPWSLFTDPMTVFEMGKRAVCGSCALVVLMYKQHIYVASVGDSRAVLGRQQGDRVVAIPLSQDHTARSPTEFSRLCEEHPGEQSTVVVRGRVLGGLMPTRAFGDARYKWSRSIQQTMIPFLFPSRERGIPRNLLTPPYVTAEPEVLHYERDDRDLFLILASDGLWDEVSSESSVELVSQWRKQGVLDPAMRLSKAALSAYEQSRHADDGERIQQVLSVPAPKSRKVRDDITVQVVSWEGVQRGQPMEEVAPYTSPGSPQLDRYVRYLKRSSKL
jgi:pyruvate dehydrogenase phosphatase